MAKAQVGTGSLTPFKKGSTGSTSIPGSTSRDKNAERENNTHKAMITKATGAPEKLTPFKTGNNAGEPPGNPTVPKFRERKDCGIDTHGYKAFKE